MQVSAFSTPQLAEFVAAVSAAETERSSAVAVVERAAEALGADVAAIVSGGKALAAIGYPEGTAPVDELEAVTPGTRGCSLDVPVIGACAASAAVLDWPPGAKLVIARQGPDELTREEKSLLRGMAQVTSMTMRTLRVLDDERSTLEEVERLARQQAALRRVATLVARSTPPAEVFAAVAEEVARVVPSADVAWVGRYDVGAAIEFVGGWSRDGAPEFVGKRVSLGGNNLATRVFETNQPARVDYRADDGTPATVLARQWARAAVGAPIRVDDRPWGVMSVGTLGADELPAGIECELAEFTELAATAIANAEAREEVRRVADEQAALRRVATLVARGDAPDAVFAALAAELGRVFSVAVTAVVRYDESGRTATSLGTWNSIGYPGTDTRVTARLGGHNLTTLVWETRRPARIVGFDPRDENPISAMARGRGAQSGVGVPLIVGGRVWGSLQVVLVGQATLPPGTEERLSDFAELAATAVANAQARDELRCVAEEQAALRHVATLVATGVPAAEIFDAVVEETRRVLGVDATMLSRFHSDGTASIMAAETRLPPPHRIGERSTPDDGTMSALVYSTGRPARIDAYDVVPGRVSEWLHDAGYGGSVGAPVVVDGQMWGVLIAIWARDRDAVPSDTENRLVQFTELLATAIANAEAQAELTASRARIVATADATRRQLVRDLHDGAQQRLVHTIITLKLARRARANEETEATEKLLDEALDHAERTNAELRELVHGILPSVLIRGGLAAAVQELVSRLRVPVTVNVARDRLAPQIEANAYFVIAEALTNVAKHSRARIADVAGWLDDDALHVEVWDDGVGGASPAGSGLLGLRDRVVALGGRLEIESPPGAGTRIEVELPLAAPVAPDSR